jgi:hypothetical protein
MPNGIRGGIKSRLRCFQFQNQTQRRVVLLPPLLYRQRQIGIDQIEIDSGQPRLFKDFFVGLRRLHWSQLAFSGPNWQSEILAPR